MDKKFKIFVIVAIVILTLITVAGAVTVFSLKSNAEATKEEKIDKESLEFIYLSQSINSNLKIGEDGMPHIIRLSVGFEINNKDDDYKTFMADFSTREIIVRDAIISILRNMTYNEIDKDKLGETIKDTVNTLLDTSIIQSVYFSDFFVQ